MLKKFSLKVNIIITLLIIFMVALAIQAVSANDDFFSLGEIVKSTSKARENKILAIINDRVNITQQDVNRAFAIKGHLYKLQKKEFEKIKQNKSFTDKELSFMQPKAKTEDEILQELIEKEMLYLESIEQGCDVSSEEVKQYIEEQKKISQDILDGKVKVVNNEEAVAGIKQVESFAEGMGLTIEEYWEYMEASLKKDFSITQLKSKVLQQLSETEQLDYEKSTQAINEYIQTLYDKYEIKINN